MHYRSAPVVACGIRGDVESFDYQSTLADLDQGLDRLASDIRNAFIRYTSDPGMSDAFAHADRELFRIVHLTQMCTMSRDITVVELRGFEPLAPSMRTRCATGLRHSPQPVG